MSQLLFPGLILYYIDTSGCLTVHVLSVSKCYSVLITTCKILQGNVRTHLVPARVESDTEPICGVKDAPFDDNVMVIFSLHCAKFNGIVVGAHIQIHEPWYVFSDNVIILTVL